MPDIENKEDYDEKIYQTLKAGIDKLREMQDPLVKQSDVYIVSKNSIAIAKALLKHGKYINKKGAIKTKLSERIKMFFGVSHD